MHTGRTERPLGQLFADLGRQLATLARQEVELARAEVTDRLALAARDAGLIAGGIALAWAGGLVLLAAIVLALVELGLAAWVSALLVGLVAVTLGSVTAWRAVGAVRRRGVLPEWTVETLRDDVDRVREQVR